LYYSGSNFKQLSAIDCGVSVIVTTLRALHVEFTLDDLYKSFGKHLGFIVDMSYQLRSKYNVEHKLFTSTAEVTCSEEIPKEKKAQMVEQVKLL
jgi:hypothetical protein